MQGIIVKSTFLSVAVLSAAAAQETPQSEYRVNAGDNLEISVWKEEDLQREVRVRPDGMISFPLAGELAASGRTVVEITRDLEARLARYIPDLVITVTVVEVAGNQVFVIGQVARPGVFVMNPQLDVVQALSLAGGLTPFAQQKAIRILRREEGAQIAIRFDYTEVLQGRSLEQNIPLKSGDIIVVP